MEEDYDNDYAWGEEEAVREDEKQALDYALPKAQRHSNPNRCILCFHIAFNIVTYVERLAPLNKSTTYLSIARRDPRKKYSALLEPVNFSSSDWSGQLGGEAISNLQTVLSDTSIVFVALVSDNSLCCWQLSVGQSAAGMELLRRCSSALTDIPTQLTWSTDGQCLFTSQRSKIVIWNVDLQPVAHIAFTNPSSSNITQLLYFHLPIEAIGAILNGTELRIWWLLPEGANEDYKESTNDQPAIVLPLPPFGPPLRDITTSNTVLTNQDMIVVQTSSVVMSDGSWRVLLCYGGGRLAVIKVRYQTMQRTSQLPYLGINIAD